MAEAWDLKKNRVLGFYYMDHLALYRFIGAEVVLQIPIFGTGFNFCAPCCQLNVLGYKRGNKSRVGLLIPTRERKREMFEKMLQMPS